MRVKRASSYTPHHSIEGRVDPLLLGRLGSELAYVYRDTLQAPLPSKLQALVDQLDVAMSTTSTTGQRNKRS